MRKRYGGFDFLRILSCCGILFLHFSNYTCPDGVYFGQILIDPQSDRLNLNCIVEVFFAISGFLMYETIQKGNDDFDFAKVMRSRLIRIIPMLTISTLLLVILGRLLVLSGDTHGIDIYDFHYYLWLILSSCLGIEYIWGGISPLVNFESWFVDILLVCNVLYLISIKLSKKLKISNRYVLYIYVIWGIICHLGNYEVPFCSFICGRGYVPFFAGVLLAAWLEEKKDRRYINIYALSVVTTYGLYMLFWPDYIIYEKPLLVGVFVAPALVILFSTETAGRWFSAEIWGKLSKVTYSVYLTHVSLIYIIFLMSNLLGIKIDFPHEIILFTFIILAFLFGGVMYLVAEKPITSLLSKTEK